MTLQEYYLNFGIDGIGELAMRAGTSRQYLLNLVYSPRHRLRPKLPSLKMAEKLVEGSGGMLTFKGLANPIKTIPLDVRKRVDRAA